MSYVVWVRALKLATGKEWAPLANSNGAEFYRSDFIGGRHMLMVIKPDEFSPVWAGLGTIEYPDVVGTELVSDVADPDLLKVAVALMRKWRQYAMKAKDDAMVAFVSPIEDPCWDKLVAGSKVGGPPDWADAQLRDVPDVRNIDMARSANDLDYLIRLSANSRRGPEVVEEVFNRMQPLYDQWHAEFGFPKSKVIEVTEIDKGVFETVIHSPPTTVEPRVGVWFEEDPKK